MVSCVSLRCLRVICITLVGDIVAIQGGTVQSTPPVYSTSKLHYHLRLKGTLGLNVLATKLTEQPWSDVPDVHPLVPLRALSRVKDRQQICVAAVVIDNPGAIERQTKEKMASVCNAIVQQGATKVRCSFWDEHAEELADVAVNQAVLLYQVLVTKRKTEDSWELQSWRGTSIRDCPQAMAELLSLDGRSKNPHDEIIVRNDRLAAVPQIYIYIYRYIYLFTYTYTYIRIRL